MVIEIEMSRPLMSSKFKAINCPLEKNKVRRVLVKLNGIKNGVLAPSDMRFIGMVAEEASYYD